MLATIKSLKERHPGYTFELNDDGQIVMQKKCLGEPRIIGVFDSIDDLVDHINAIPGC